MSKYINGISNEEFIERAIKKHGNKFSYSKTSYVNSQTKVIITCTEHGDFKQKPFDHLRGYGCLICKNPAASLNGFIALANKIHGNKYDYSQVVYTDSQTKVNIICKEHGIFKQTPNMHIRRKNNRASGCPQCALILKQKPNIISREKAKKEFETKARKIHGNKYEYFKTNYINSKTKVVITCPKHGDFEQEVGRHLRGDGCCLCKASKGEIKVKNWLLNNNIDFIEQYKFPSFDKFKKVDFYIPKHNLVIEYDGEQHFNPIWGKARLEIQQKRDSKFNDWCNDNNINIFRLKYLNDVNDELENIKWKLT